MKRQASSVAVNKQIMCVVIEDDYRYITTARTRLAISELLVLSHFD